MRDLDKIRECFVIRLDHRQMATAILGVIVVSAGAFAVGVFVGEGHSPEPTAVVAPEAVEAAVAAALEASAEEKIDSLLTRIPPGTRELTEALTQPSVVPAPLDPTQAARIETQRQIASARQAAATRSLGPVSVQPAKEQAPDADKLSWVARDPQKERAALEEKKKVDAGFSLQVSAFRSAPPGERMAKELRQGGYDARVLKITDDHGTHFWRVLVGRFADAKKAGAFRGRFEATEGYPTILIPVR